MGASVTLMLPATGGHPESASVELKGADPVRELVEAGDHATAERLLRDRPPGRTGLDLAEDRLWLSVCLSERARTADPAEAAKLLDEAAAVLERAATEAARHTPENERAARLRTLAQLRGPLVLQQQQKPDHLLTAATALREKHRGRVEELLVLSLVYHAHRQKQEFDRAVAVRDQMRDAFDRLPPGAFPAAKGEYSREYWTSVWFGPQK